MKALLHKIVAASLVSAIAACTATKEQAEIADAKFITAPVGDSISTGRKFEQVPTIAASVDGQTIYVAWYSGGEAPGPGNFVTVSVSPDQGNSWLHDQLVIYPTSPGVRIFDPALWRDPSGQVHLFYGSAKDSLIWDGFGGVNAVAIDYKDSKLQAGNANRLADGVMSNKPVYIGSKDQIILPVYIDKPLPEAPTGNYPKNGAFLLAVDGKSVKLPSAYSQINIADSLRIHDEPQVVEVSDKGDFLVLLRTTKGIYSANSDDYGKTWSELVPFTAAGPTTSSRFFIGKLSSGNLLLVANASTTRNNMTAFLSPDGGKTWPHKLLLDARENVSYPDADQTPDGNIHVVFDRDRTGAKDILYSRFDEDMIMKGDTSSVVKLRVNSK